MRAKIIFSIQEGSGILPHYHQNLLADWIETVKQEMPEWNDYSTYHFSSLRGQASSLQEGIRYLTNRVKFVIASPNESFIHLFIEQVFTRTVWQVGPLYLHPSYADRQFIEPELGKAVKYLCLAPLVPSFMSMYDQEAGKKFVDPEESNFSNQLYECMFYRIDHSGSNILEKTDNYAQFQLVPEYEYLDKLRRQGKLFARNHVVNFLDRQYEVRGYIFPFTLYAQPLIQSYVYDYGLGAFTQQGHGMVELHTT